MKYAVIGAGGTGGMIGFYITKAGKDVTLIARGEHLAKMQEKGLTVERMWDGSMETLPVSATDMEHYRERRESGGETAWDKINILYFLYGNRPVTENND